MTVDVRVSLITPVAITTARASFMATVTVVIPLVMSEVVTTVSRTIMELVFVDVEVRVEVVVTSLTASFVVTADTVEVMCAVADLICRITLVTVLVDRVGLGTRREHLEVR